MVGAILKLILFAINGFLPLIIFLQFLAFNSIHCLYLHQKLCINFCIRHDTGSLLQIFREKLVLPPQMILGFYAHDHNNVISNFLKVGIMPIF